jgi:hypothetical protein
MNFTSIGDRLNRMELGWLAGWLASWLAAAIAIALLQTGVSVIRWQRVALECGASLAPQQALGFNLIASFFN